MANDRLPIVLHLPPEQIARRYRACRPGVEKTHWQVLWLLTRPDQPLSPARAAEQVGLSPVWTRALLKRWNAQGPDGLDDPRAATNGGQGKLTPERQIDLWAALRHSPPDGGLWTGAKSPPMSAIAGMSASASRPAGPGCVAWASRRRSPDPGIRRPPRPPRGGRGKDALADRLARLPREHPGRVVEVWAEDEARLGLKPIARRVWATRGQRPLSYGRTKYQWTYVYGFVHPASGRNLELLLPSADTDWMGLALGEFARWADPAGEKPLVLLVDNAGWHVARRLAVPTNVVLHRLPPCTPEL